MRPQSYHAPSFADADEETGMVGHADQPMPGSTRISGPASLTMVPSTASSNAENHCCPNGTSTSLVDLLSSSNRPSVRRQVAVASPQDGPQSSRQSPNGVRNVTGPPESLRQPVILSQGFFDAKRLHTTDLSEAVAVSSPIKTKSTFEECTPGRRLSLKLALLIYLCFFTVAPALVLWRVIDLMANDAFSTMESLGQSSVQVVSSQLRSSMQTNARAAFLKIVESSEIYMNMSVWSFLAKRPFDRTWTVTDFQEMYEFNEIAIEVVGSNSLCSTFVFTLLVRDEPYEEKPLTWYYQWLSYQKFSYDPMGGGPEPTMYLAELVINSWVNDSAIQYFSLEPVTGAKKVRLMSYPRGAVSTAVRQYRPQMATYWEPDIDFSPDSIFTQITIRTEIPAQDHHVYFGFKLQTSIYDVSKILRSALNSPNERAFLCFRTEGGTLLGTSHGRFFSHSDFDYTHNNPVSNPPPVADFRRYTAVNCSDATISAFGVWLMQTYYSWASIPEFSQMDGMVEGRMFWSSNMHITSKFGLAVQLVLLIDHESVLGSISRQHDATVKDIRATNVKLTIVLACSRLPCRPNAPSHLQKRFPHPEPHLPH